LFLKKYAPSNNGSRHQIKLNSLTLSSDKCGGLNLGFKKSAGRDNSGRVVLRGRRGYLSNYLLVDFKRRGTTKMALVLNNTKNSNRNALVSLIKYSTGGYSYVLTALGFINGFWTQSMNRPERFSFKYAVGCAVFLKHIPNQSVFFNLEVREREGGKIARAAGTSCFLIQMNHETNLAFIKIPSGLRIKVSAYCLVVLGRSSNPFFYKTVVGKFGNNFKKGFKSKVRGVAMNPVDHPHGGRTKTNSPETSLWGKIAKKNK